MLDHVYLPEPLTFLTVMVVAILFACANYLVIWFQNRKEKALLWMAAAAAICGAGLYARGLLPDPAGMILGIPAVLFGIACLWTGCRVMTGQQPHWPGLAAALLAWPVIATASGIIVAPRGPTILSYVIATLLLGLALRAVLAKQRPRQLGHRFVAALLAVEGGVCALWTVGQILTALGLAGFGSDINIPFSAFTVTGFNLMMSYAFVAWTKEESELARAREAYRDALTGIGNRRRLNEELAEAVRQARRRHHALAIIMIDIDKFKVYNDTYGHPAGDACLAAVATCLADAISHPEDEVMRYGGEEFTVLLRRAEAPAAIALAERMRLAVRALNQPHAGLDWGIVTISLGVAAMEGSSATGETLIAAADRALYRAKEAGRDRAVLFTGEDAAEPPLTAGRIRVSGELSGGELSGSRNAPPIKI